jgi:hypothetical protein
VVLGELGFDSCFCCEVGWYAHYAGVVDEDIEMRDGGGDGYCRGADGGERGEVEGDEDGFCGGADGFDFLNHWSDFGFGTPEEEDCFWLSGGEGEGCLGSDAAAGGTGDDD